MVGERHPNKDIQAAVVYAIEQGWGVIKSTGGSAHAWGVIRCPGDCPQVSIFSTPRVPENHARHFAGPWTDAHTPRRRTTMSEHLFTLTVTGALSDARLDALFRAGCDDATLSTKGELTFCDFDREAPSLLDAVISAIAAVESIPDAEVLHVDPDELVWASEIAQRTGRSRQSIDMLIRGQRGPGSFPDPASHATRNPLWRWSEDEAWFAAYQGRPADRERSSVLGAINGALQTRHILRSSTQTAPLRQAVSQLLAS